MTQIGRTSLASSRNVDIFIRRGLVFVTKPTRATSLARTTITCAITWRSSRSDRPLGHWGAERSAVFAIYLAIERLAVDATARCDAEGNTGKEGQAGWKQLALTMSDIPDAGGWQTWSVHFR